MKTNLLILSVFALFISCSTQPGTQYGRPSATPVSKSPLQSSSPWVDETLSRMTLEEKVAQLVFERADGGYLSADDERWKYYERLVRERKIGGFVFFAGDVYEYVMQINKLQAASEIPLLIASDFEFGTAMRVRRATLFPRAMLVGATRNPQYAYEMGKVIAKEARALGVHQDYAPVVDINNNPMNPVINTRSFGEDPRLVSEMAAAFTRGLQEGPPERQGLVGGVIATAKHFPGHGDTDVDSHLDMPVLPFSKERLDSLELVGFRRAVDAGVMSMMIAHLSVPAYDTTTGLPATLSRPIITDLLQNQLGFKGLIVTDAMTMQGVTKAFSTADAAVRAIKAGTDLVLLPPDVDVAIDAIVGAVRRGEITEERINVSVRKLLALKQSLGLVENRFVDPNAVSSIVGSAEHRRLAKQIARDGITVVKNDKNILPLQKNNLKKIVGIAFGDLEDPTTGAYFRSLVRSRVQRYEDLRVDNRSNAIEYDSVLTRAATGDILLIHMYVATRSEQMTGFFKPQQAEFLNNLLKLNKPTVVVSFGNPYLLSAFPTVQAYLAGYSQADVVVEAAVEAIFGEIETKGKLPITIPASTDASKGGSGGYAYGTGITLPKVTLRYDEPIAAGFDPERLKRVDEVMKQAVRDSAFPGGVVLVARNGVVGYHKAFGTFEYDPYSRQVDVNTIYDLASVTKVIATTSAVMRLVDEKKLSLDDPVVKHIPQFGQKGKEKITIYNLMVHNSGLPAWRRFYDFCTTPQCVLDSVYASPLQYNTGDSTIYSDLGLITIGKVIEKVAGTTLDRYVDSVFFKPLGMHSTMYNPPRSLWNRIAPTEIDTFWQRTGVAVRGRVHDENAATLGGVSGHAGLFSTASDLAVMMQMLLNGGTYGGVRYLQTETVQKFITRQSEKSTRAIGWDTKNLTGYTSAGRLFGPKSFGHTGFTGTSLWADPEKNLFVILLTNRVYPTRNNTKIFDVRPKVADAVMEAVVK
ncbi:MAG TPA: glycoside hydrolase family 3 N-terminal domain-containing protein [Bacteroidota bacterium]|nr:glycoside hydrolase family 3 N-terminal domain-containing protein [Bacteroidota bacterium]